MKRHTTCARGHPGPITQTDGRFWVVHDLFVALLVPAGVWLLHGEQSQCDRVR